MIHQRTHPVPVEGCDPCRWSSVKLKNWTTSPAQEQQFLHAAMNEYEVKRYKRLVAQGIEPDGTTTPRLDYAEQASRFRDEPYNAMTDDGSKDWGDHARSGAPGPGLGDFETVPV